MKKILIVMMFSVATVLPLTACSDNTEDKQNDHQVQEDVIGENEAPTKKEFESELDEHKNDDWSGSSSKGNEDKSANDQTKSKASNSLAEYTSEEIEYARIWLQMGENQHIDALNVASIPAGQPLNPNDETSASYPEDVIQLSGSRLIDGSITYSSNGDGTINVYNVPLRWDGEYPAGEDFYQEMIENTKQLSIDQGDDQKVIELIQLLESDN